MKLYLVRHGQTMWNVQRRMQGWEDSALTEEGQLQALQHGHLLKRENVDVIYASDLGRVRETVKRIRMQCDAEVQYLKDLRECCMGAWEGQQIEDIKANWPAEYAAWRYGDESVSPPEGESLVQLKNRVNQVLKSVVKTSNKLKIAFVTHGLTTRALLDLLLELSETQKRSLRIFNNVVHVVDTESEGKSVWHFKDAWNPISGLCNSG